MSRMRALGGRRGEPELPAAGDSQRTGPPVAYGLEVAILWLMISVAVDVLSPLQSENSAGVYRPRTTKSQSVTPRMAVIFGGSPVDQSPGNHL